MTSLEDLCIEGNTFSGTIPDELYQCIELRCLYLQDNQFNGTLSTLIDELSDLEYGETYFFSIPYLHYTVYLIRLNRLIIRIEI
jgi:hypothetical protein